MLSPSLSFYKLKLRILFFKKMQVLQDKDSPRDVFIYLESDLHDTESEQGKTMSGRPACILSL